MPDLLWFHAFNRDEVAEAVKVLIEGPRHHPDESNETRRHERELGIEPPCVYAYLGRTIPSFGENALALENPGLRGEMSPFDSGGLIKKMAPVADLKTEEKVAYLEKATWKTQARRKLLKAYPTEEPVLWNGYLEGQRPKPSGPHEVWKKCGVAAIWDDNAEDDWRCWTWEGRAASLNVTALRAWTCSPGRTKAFIEHIKKSGRKSTLRLLKSFRHGGVSRLVANLRSEQAA